MFEKIQKTCEMLNFSLQSVMRLVTTRTRKETFHQVARSRRLWGGGRSQRSNTVEDDGRGRMEVTKRMMNTMRMGDNQHACFCLASIPQANMATPHRCLLDWNTTRQNQSKNLLFCNHFSWDDSWNIYVIKWIKMSSDDLWWSKGNVSWRT